MSKINLTSQFVKLASCPEGKRKIDLFDSSCKGLMLEIRNSGGKTFYLRFKDVRGATRQLRLADFRDISLAQARQLANKKRSDIAMGIDPFEKKAELKKVPKLCDFIADRYLPYVKSYKRSWITDESLLRNHILPNFGHFYLDEVTKKDVIQFIAKHCQTHKPGSVNRVIILLRYIFNLAIRWEIPGITKNPTAGVPLLEENNKLERYLTQDEAQTLFAAVKQSENVMLAFIVPMLILTGTRKREVLDAKWSEFDLDRRLWRIGMSKSGKARHVPISDGVLTLLESVPRIDGCEYVFANPATAKPYVSIYCSWNTARQKAGLPEVRMHDLRHSFASFLVNNGRSLYEVQKILGHTQIKTTQRYAHLANDTLLDAANQVAKLVPLVMPNQINAVPLIQVA
jgi:integrase